MLFKTQISRQLLRKDVPPFLNKGITIANFHLAGIVQFEIQLSKISVITIAIRQEKFEFENQDFDTKR